MRHMRSRDRSSRYPLLGAVVVASVLVGWPAAAEAPSPPPYYAIRDVTVMTGTGERLERATVLIADGLIEAVGSGLEIPADAWVIEGSGLQLYPGLIDAMTNLGQKQAEAEGSSPPRGRLCPSHPGGMLRGC